MSMNFKMIFATLAAVMLTSVALADATTDSKTLTTVAYVEGAVDGKQTVLSGTDGQAVLYGNAAGQTVGRAIINTTSAYDSEAADSSKLVQEGVVVSKLGAKQNEITAPQNTAVTYGATAGALGSQAIYQSSGAYNNTTQNNLAQADHVNSAVQSAMQAHLSCHECSSGSAATCAPANCLLWTMDNNISGTFVPHGS